MDELSAQLRAYEEANNSHLWENVQPFVHSQATYFFTDGTFNGIEEIREAVSSTFERIKDETYAISEVKWVYHDEKAAACTYTFHWKGVVDGETAQGTGRGTNIWVKTPVDWKIIHEHLSK